MRWLVITDLAKARNVKLELAASDRAAVAMYMATTGQHCPEMLPADTEAKLAAAHLANRGEHAVAA
jgi:hypothetical protein